MMDRRYWLSGICIAILASVPLMSAKETATKQTISVRSFSQNEVLGVLGVPIGTVVRINGVARDGNKTDFKADQGRWILEIDRVNGRPLKDIVSFRVSRRKETSSPSVDSNVTPQSMVDFLAMRKIQIKSILSNRQQQAPQPKSVIIRD